MELVRIDEIFSVNYGVNLDLNKLTMSKSKDSIPFVSRTSKNNGVSAYVDSIDNLTPNPSHTLSVAGGGSVLATFYQPKPYYSGRDLYFLRPMFELSATEMLIYCTYIEKNKYRYSFGRQANKTLDSLLVPCLQEVQKIAKQINYPSAPASKPETNKKITLGDRGWGWFVYEDLFDIERGESLYRKNSRSGAFPYVSTSAFNNGITAFINSFNQEANAITVAYDGTIGEAFYHSAPFFASEKIAVLRLKNKKLTSSLALFLITLIKLEKFKFNYGLKWSIEKRMKKSQIKLPIDDSGNPDWQFMEDYIKSLPYSVNLQCPP